MTGRRPKPTAIRRAEGNPGKRAWNHAEPQPPTAKPTCPRHLGAIARTEWQRLAGVLHRMGVLTQVDRAALAAYCACYGRWVEAERRLAETPALIRTPSGHVQQSPWLSIANRQMELMGRYMAELGLTPASRSRVAAYSEVAASDRVDKIQFVVVYEGRNGELYEAPLHGKGPAIPHDPEIPALQTHLLDGRL